jgi:hypothetical protein
MAWCLVTEAALFLPHQCKSSALLLHELDGYHVTVGCFDADGTGRLYEESSDPGDGRRYKLMLLAYR